MTVPSVAASMSDLDSNFGKGYSLGSYYTTRWYGTNNSRGNLQGSGPISISDLMNRRNTSPVTPSPAGGVVYNSSQNITLPMFNNLTITAVSGQGGQGGFSGNCAGGGYGGYGNPSSLAGYVGTDYGPRGAPSGGAGAQASASTSLSINDSNQAEIIARYGTAPYGVVGGGGGGGATGYNTRSESVCTEYGWRRACVWSYCQDVYVCVNAYTAYYCDSAVGGGGGGALGYIKLEWT